MGTLLVPAIVCILGAFVYLASSKNAKVAEMGRLAFLAGLLVTVYLLAGHSVKLL